MLRLGVPVGGGTDSTRTTTYKPFLSLWWLITGKTVGGTPMRGPEQNMTREQALRAYTTGSAWFSFDENNVGSLEPGKMADLIVVSGDYLTMPEDQIKHLESVLTIVGGKPVYAAAEFQGLAPR
jgi:predicted amidohydrolase YtcJ